MRELAKFESIGINQRHFLGGACAGICYTNVAFVFDLLKVRAQVNKKKQIQYREEISLIYR